VHMYMYTYINGWETNERFEYTYFNFHLLNIIAKGVNVYKKGDFSK